jgi:hypothetical protein
MWNSYQRRYCFYFFIPPWALGEFILTTPLGHGPLTYPKKFKCRFWFTPPWAPRWYAPSGLGVSMKLLSGPHLSQHQWHKLRQYKSWPWIIARKMDEKTVQNIHIYNKLNENKWPQHLDNMHHDLSTCLTRSSCRRPIGLMSACLRCEKYSNRMSGCRLAKCPRARHSPWQSCQYAANVSHSDFNFQREKVEKRNMHVCKRIFFWGELKIWPSFIIVFSHAFQMNAVRILWRIVIDSNLAKAKRMLNRYWIFELILCQLN